MLIESSGTIIRVLPASNLSSCWTKLSQFSFNLRRGTTFECEEVLKGCISRGQNMQLLVSWYVQSINSTSDFLWQYPERKTVWLVLLGYRKYNIATLTRLKILIGHQVLKFTFWTIIIFLKYQNCRIVKVLFKVNLVIFLNSGMKKDITKLSTACNSQKC
jgi:hypothetical protein